LEKIVAWALDFRAAHLAAEFFVVLQALFEDVLVVELLGQLPGFVRVLYFRVPSFVKNAWSSWDDFFFFWGRFDLFFFWEFPFRPSFAFRPGFDLDSNLK
jgi:hypothetical protein